MDYSKNFALKNRLFDLIQECTDKALSYVDIKIEKKNDGSIVTQADIEINSVIKKKLKSIDADIPIISEESKLNKNDFLQKIYWLIDPIDGTSSFAKNLNGYTINIALIENGIPVLGIISHPPTNTIWFGSENNTIIVKDNIEKHIHVSNFEKNNFKVILSKNYDPKTKALVDKLPCSNIAYFSSSLKFCKLAEGKAHLYPRLESISKWDIAAGDAILRSAGGTVLDDAGIELKYNSKSFRTGQFFAVSSKSLWHKYIYSNL